MSQASLGLNPCFLYLTFELFDVRTWYWLYVRRWFEPIDSYCTFDSWGLQLYCTEAYFTHPGRFLHQPRPFYTSWTLWFWHSHRRHQGEELALYITIRADENFVDLHCFVEGPKFWKIVPHLFDFLCCVYFDFIGQVQKCRKQIYFCNIVMVGHFTFGLCQRLQSGQRL